MNKIHVISPLIGILLVSCGGGGSGPLVGPSTADDVVNTDVLLNNNGCEQEYYQTMIGRYTGMVEFLGVDQVLCTWNETVILSGNSMGPHCDISAITSGTVEQQVFTRTIGSSDYPFQCFDDNGRRTVSEPLNGTYPVDEYPYLDNSNFPVEINIHSNSNIDRGPNFGDNTVIADYFHLFDGREVADAILVEGDGAITIINGDGHVIGTLTKVAQQ